MPERKPDKPRRDRSFGELIEANVLLQERGRRLLEQLQALAADIAEARPKTRDARSKWKK